MNYGCEVALCMRPRLGDRKMTTVAKLSRAYPEAEVEVEMLKTIVIFCGIGLTVSLFLISFGLDITPGFF
jgi:Na+/H+ antiporter NhaA